MTVLNVDDICTDADLVNVVGSSDRVTRACPSLAQRNAFRAAALQDVVDALAQRSPPVFETDLTAPTELRSAVAYRALHKIFLSAVADDGDMHHVLARNYDREYQSAARARFSVQPGGLSSPAGWGFTLERR